MEIEVKGGKLTVTVKSASVHDGPHDDLTGRRTKLIEAEVNVSGTVTIRKIDYTINVDYRWLTDPRPIYQPRGVDTGRKTYWQEDYRWNGGYKRVDSNKTVEQQTATRHALEALVAEALEKFNDESPDWQKESFRMRLESKISHAEGQIAGRLREIAEYRTEIMIYRLEMQKI